MATDTHGFQNKAWPLCLMRLGSVRAVVREIISPLAQSETVGHEAADMAAQALGLSRRRVYRSDPACPARQRPRDGSGARPVGGGKGKGACRNRSSASSTSYCKAVPDQAEAQPGGLSPRSHSGVQGSKLRVPARNTVALRIASLDPRKVIRRQEGGMPLVTYKVWAASLLP